MASLPLVLYLLGIVFFLEGEETERDSPLECGRPGGKGFVVSPFKLFVRCAGAGLAGDSLV